MLRLLPKKVKQAWHVFPKTTATSKQQKTAANSKQQEMTNMNRLSFMDRQHIADMNFKFKQNFQQNFRLRHSSKQQLSQKTIDMNRLLQQKDGVSGSLTILSQTIASRKATTSKVHPN